MADDNLYEDGGETTPKKGNDDGGATALLDKTFFGDKELKPGVRCEVEITRVMDDQVMVKKVPESEYKSSTDTEGEIPEPDAEMESLMG